MSTKTKVQNVKQEAEKIIEQYALTSPVRVFELADLLGIGWKLCTSEEILSVLSEKDKEIPRQDLKEMVSDILGFYDSELKLLYLHDSQQPITRKRFTMAHEIGHSVLHGNKGKKQYYRKTLFRKDIVKPSHPVEMEANYFAGYLLMPDKDIISVLPYTRMMFSGDQIVERFCKVFAVSPEAMRIRLKTFKKEHPDIWEEYNMVETLF